MQWYALRSKPNREGALWLEVDAHGYQSFYPHMRVQPANPRSRKSRPYFPGYLFVRAKLAVVGQSVFAWLPYSQAPVPDGLVQASRRRLLEIEAGGGEQLAGLERGDACKHLEKEVILGEFTRGLEELTHRVRNKSQQRGYWIKTPN